MMKAVSLHDKLRDLPKLYLIIYSDAEKLTPVTAELSSTHYHFAATVCIDGELKAKHKLCHSQKEDAPWLALDYGEKSLWKRSSSTTDLMVAIRGPKMFRFESATNFLKVERQWQRVARLWAPLRDLPLRVR